jgi:CubicO group peptidase (beta-lactamase class C family)
MSVKTHSIILMSDAVTWGERLRELAEEARVPGAALGIWAGGTEILAACGVLSAATGEAATADSLFQIGSITKMWTATMIMQLIDEGRLSLRTTISEALPGVRIGARDIGAHVTIRHLLTHTSGIEGDLLFDPGRGDDCVELYVDELARAVSLFPPGASFSYCNSGFVLLGRVIEVLDGRTWDESVRERLIMPLGLTRTATLPEEAILHRAAVGHRAEGDPVHVWCLPRGVGPATAITATALDLLTFARLHLDGGSTSDGSGLLSRPSVLAMRQQHATIPDFAAPGAAVGLGWQLNCLDNRTIIGHDGSTIGQSAYLRIDPQARVAACLLTNSEQSHSVFAGLFPEIFRHYAGGTMPDDPGPADVPCSPDLERHAGRYVRAARRFDVSLRGDRLHVVATPIDSFATLLGQDPEELVLYPADSSGVNFVYRSSDEEPWTPVSFGTLSDQTPYLFTSRRIAPRAALCRPRQGIGLEATPAAWLTGLMSLRPGYSAPLQGGARPASYGAAGPHVTRLRL